MSNPVEKLAQGLEERTPKWIKKLPFSKGKKNMKGDMTAVLIVPLVFAIICIVAAVIFMIWWGAVEPTFLTIYANMAAQGMPVSMQYQTIPNTLFGYSSVVYQWLPIIGWMVLLSIIFSALFVEVNPLLWLLDVLLIPIYFWVIAIENNIIVTLFNQAVTIGGYTLKTTLTNQLAPGVYFLEYYPYFAFITMLLFIIVMALRTWFFKPQQWSGGGGQRVQQGAGNTASLSEW